MAKNKALGRGLDDLFGMDKELKNNVTEINIDDITNYENQPRKNFKEDTLNELAQSIKEKGIIQPIIVSPKDDKYEIIVGERRWRAAKIAGLKKIPCIIKDISIPERLEIALIENIQREDLNPIEEAKAYEEIMNNFNITHDELAKKIGKSRTAVSNTIRLLKLPEDVRKEIIKGSISEGHARVLVGLEYDEMKMIISKIKSGQLNVREVEKMVSKLKNPDKNISKKKKENVTEKEIETDKSNKNKLTLRGGELVEEALTEYESIDKNRNETNIEKNQEEFEEEYNQTINQNVLLDSENIDDIIKVAQLELRKMFRSGVTISKDPSNQGKIEIPYKNLQHLRHILEFFGYGF